MHKLDVDTLVLASAGISADEIDEIDWTLLGLNPPEVIVGSPQSGDESSSPDEPPTEVSSTPVVPRSSPPASPSSASSSSKRKRDSSPRSSTEGAAASQLPPPSGLAVRLSTCGRGLQPPLRNVQAVLRATSKHRSPRLHLPPLSGHLVVSRPRAAMLL
ncbi:hypothetical protein PF008_g31276 [Phytophthora fragariae]|uniref:Uncharacterized protein n=1 Tax=Phytophthora fragariae TaxID=53985 RepID=A0A6G0Q348_9STRA|nr:hypothetical protein PF008_g31276 [Phytophthora fragariae]